MPIEYESETNDASNEQQPMVPLERGLGKKCHKTAARAAEPMLLPKRAYRAALYPTSRSPSLVVSYASQSSIIRTMSANRKAYRSRSGHRRGYTQGFGDANEIVMHEVDRDRMTFRGPALVEDPGSTLVIDPGEARR